MSPRVQFKFTAMAAQLHSPGQAGAELSKCGSVFNSEEQGWFCWGEPAIRRSRTNIMHVFWEILPIGKCAAGNVRILLSCRDKSRLK